MVHFTSLIGICSVLQIVQVLPLASILNCRTTDAFSILSQIPRRTRTVASSRNSLLLGATEAGVDDNDSSIAESSNTYNDGDNVLPVVEENEPKFVLLSMLRDIKSKDSNNVAIFGDTSSNNERSKIFSLAKDLAGSNYVLPLDSPTSSSSSSYSEWELLSTNAPDLLGLKGGPLSQLVSIKQRISSSNMNDDKMVDIVLEYKPSDGIVSLTNNILDGVQNDRLEQTIMFDYQKQPMNKFDLTIKGTKVNGTRFGNLPSLKSPVSIPFGSFKVLFNDGGLCIQQTIQGEFLFIYQRID